MIQWNTCCWVIFIFIVERPWSQAPQVLVSPLPAVVHSANPSAALSLRRVSLNAVFLKVSFLDYLPQNDLGYFLNTSGLFPKSSESKSLGMRAQNLYFQVPQAIVMHTETHRKGPAIGSIWFRPVHSKQSVAKGDGTTMTGLDYILGMD